MTETKKYELIITNHARERWVERVVDATRYEHLSKCKVGSGCGTCESLINDIHGALRMARKQIDGRILACYLSAKQANDRVTDVSFMETIAKTHGSDAKHMDFLISGIAILVVSQKPEEETPQLLTVLTKNMIDGTVVKNTPVPEMKKVFKRWKHEIRQGGSNE